MLYLSGFSHTNRRLVVIDEGLKDRDQLIASVLPHTTVLVLGRQEECLNRVRDVLQQHDEIDSLHLVGHGEPGQISLGQDALNASNLLFFADKVKAWADFLVSSSQILLYGCRTGAGIIGRRFVQDLAMLTGAEVFASESLVGGAALGGGWDLTVRAGGDSAPIAVFTEVAQKAYRDVFATPRLVKVVDGLDLGILNGATGIGGELLFTANVGSELWISDGTDAGTVLIKNFPETIDFPPTNVNGIAYFARDNGNYGVELWKSDGTAAGTVLVSDINIGVDGSFPLKRVNVNGTLFFSAFDNTNGYELWSSNGSIPLLVKDIIVGDRSSDPHDLTNVNGRLFFVADDETASGINTISPKLWVSDGTEGGTSVVIDPTKDIINFSFLEGPIDPTKLIGVGNTLFFEAGAFETGRELWSSDGTEGGTVLVQDITLGQDSSDIQNLTNVNGTLFFTNFDVPDPAQDTLNYALWRSDGVGAFKVDTFPSVSTGGIVSLSPPSNFTAVNNTLFFTVDDGINGEELWKNDGGRSVLVKDITPGSVGSSPNNLVESNGTLFFVANGEIWKSDGTEAGTQPVTNGFFSSSPTKLRNVGGTLFFSLSNSSNELWTLENDIPIPIQIPSSKQSPFYKYKIIAKTGDLGITDLADQPSINDKGTVAFIGSRNNETDVFSGDGTTLIDVTGSSAIASNSTSSVQINNGNKIVTNDFQLTGGASTSAIRVRDANNPGSFQDVVTTPGNVSNPFVGVLADPSINNNNDVVFTGLSGSGTSRVLATKALTGFNTNPINSGNSRPMIADNGFVVFQEQFGTDSYIKIANKDFSQVDEITTASPFNSFASFTNLGTSPGISDDGNIVTFYGELSLLGTTPLNPNPGKGIFAAINTTFGWRIQRIAGISGNGYLDPGETFKDNNNNGEFDSGDIDIGTFSDFDPNARVSVNSTQDIQRGVTIAYIAKDTTVNSNVSQKGIYTNRLSFFGSGSSAFNALDSNNTYSVNKSTLVVEVNQAINEPGFTGKIADLNIYDPLNNRDRGDVAFWIKTDSNKEAIIRARPQEVVYLDFDSTSITDLEPGAKVIFDERSVPLKWGAGIKSAFSDLGVTRPDLIGQTNIEEIKNKVIQSVQKKFDDVDANVIVLDGPPSDVGSGTHVYIGSSLKRITLNGISTSVDLFNRDVNITKNGQYIPLTQNDVAFVFLDNLFSGNGSFTKENVINVTGTAIDLNYTGINEITVPEVVNAISDVIAHEVGHDLGLSHKDDKLGQFKSEVQHLLKTGGKGNLEIELRWL